MVCVTCGYPTGQIYDVFTLLLQEKIKKEGKNCNAVDLFDLFGIRLMCCKKSLMTPFKFTDSVSY